MATNYTGTPEQRKYAREYMRKRREDPDRYAAEKARIYEWRAANRERFNECKRRSEAKYRRPRSLKRLYGLTREQWNAMLEAQGRRCGLCGTDKPSSKRPWHTDHDHRTGKVRAILCALCNVGLGAFREDPYLLARAINYLRKHKLCAVA